MADDTPTVEQARENLEAAIINYAEDCADHHYVQQCTDALIAAVRAENTEALHVIYTTVRGDEKSECWAIRKFLDDRDVFNDDIQGGDRLIAEVCKLVLKTG